MQPSSIFCRTQEARQHELATTSGLLNVRDIAEKAAIAWAKEAVAAEKREERIERSHASSRAAVRAADGPTSDDRAFSENPDRAYAEA